MQRLEAIREDWQGSCSILIENFVDQVTESIPGDFSYNEWWFSSIQNKRDEWVEEYLLPTCMSWLRDHEFWKSSEEVFEEAKVELGSSALAYLPSFSYELSDPFISASSRKIYAILAGGGALIGMLSLTPLTVLMLDQRDIGLFAGGILGAAGLIRIFEFFNSWLEEGKKLRFLGLLSRKYPKRESDLFFKRNYRKFSSEKDAQQITQEFRIHLQYTADLVLAWCWGHPKRLLLVEQEPEEQNAQTFPNPILDCLATLYCFSSFEKGTSQDTSNLLKELFQRLQVYGYKWEMISPGTPFNPEVMNDSFDTYGDIELNELIFTYQPALRYQGTLIRKGELRSISD